MSGPPSVRVKVLVEVARAAGLRLVERLEPAFRSIDAALEAPALRIFRQWLREEAGLS
ncbi:hypothetical protein GALL_268240 [mine drainage metagenome]|uniref:Uncharacterized protein n=1 Tax=mine drainage metagenome TaxID=410659 RepID=A0A1J5R7D0_9ZZZZ